MLSESTGKVWEKFGKSLGQYRKSLDSLFQDLFAIIKNIFIFAGWLGTRLFFYEL